VDGGPSYYGRFQNGLPADPGFFPIGVWGAYDFTVANVAKDKDVGLNLYVWASDPAAWGQTNIANAGMFAFQDVDNQANAGTQTKGWVLGDEQDMISGPGNNTAACDGPHPGTGARSGYQIMREQLAKATDDRLTYSNYGKGIAGPQWETDAQASCFVNAFQDITSADVYWHTDPNEASSPRSRHSWSYGQTVDRVRFLDALDGRRHPIWNFVEVGWPWNAPPSNFPGFDQITPAEIRGAVWHSIIAGARGIIYFQHSFAGPCVTHHALRATGSACYGPTIDMVRSVNAQIKQLAPVLNSPTVTSGTSANDAVRAMVKWHNGHFYVFAGSKETGNTTGRVDIPCVGDATAVRLGEAGSVPLQSGSFSDTFADGEAIHIYRIDGGSTCGLP
jgi:hypothetical protein